MMRLFNVENMEKNKSRCNSYLIFIPYLVAAKVSNLVRELRLLLIEACVIQKTNFYFIKIHPVGVLRTETDFLEMVFVKPSPKNLSLSKSPL